MSKEDISAILSLVSFADKVLDIVLETENIFYLTGGTCLSQFHKAKRYSDNLDFFAGSSPRYDFALRKLKARLADKCQLEIQ